MGRSRRRRAVRLTALLGALGGWLAAATTCAPWTPRSARHALLGVRLPRDLEAEVASALGPPRRPAPRCTLLFFWAPWCERCKPWLSSLDRLQTQVRTPVVLGVAVSSEREDVARVLRAYAVRMPQLVDADATWMRRLALDAVPRLVAVDGQGRLAYASPDEAELASLERVFWRCAATEQEARGEATSR